MQTDSLGKMLPLILFPYVQQWAERSGLTLLSQLLVDEQFRGLIERYGNEMVIRMGQDSTPGNGSGQGNEKKPAPRAEPRVSEADAHANDLTDLQDRVLAMEAQQEAQQALFSLLRSKIRPLALALGCCPECLVGVDGCPKCWGQSGVAHYPPDYMLLEAEVVSPLAARGVPLVLNTEEYQAQGNQPQRERGANHGPRNDVRECRLGE
jgi:hypothetical protein